MVLRSLPSTFKTNCNLFGLARQFFNGAPTHDPEQETTLNDVYEPSHSAAANDTVRYIHISMILDELTTI